MEDLVTLPGVGRKTANVLRSVAMDLPGLPVDTHVGRLTRRLELTKETDPVKAELALNAMVPARGRRTAFSLRLILHGRAVCLDPYGRVAPSACWRTSARPARGRVEQTCVAVRIVPDRPRFGTRGDPRRRRSSVQD